MQDNEYEVVEPIQNTKRATVKCRCVKCGIRGTFRSPGGLMYCKKHKPDDAKYIYRMCPTGCKTSGNFRAPDGKWYCSKCKPIGAKRIAGMCTKCRVVNASFRTPEGENYCSTCKPNDALDRKKRKLS